MMSRHKTAIVMCVLMAAAVPSVTSGQTRQDPAILTAAQRQAMNEVAFMDGIWRGMATTTLPSGETHELTQTERIGPFLDGAVRVIEGRGYEADGSVAFNALGIVSFNVETRAYTMRSYAQGHVGDFELTLTPNGFSWEIPAGPMTIRYTAIVEDSAWHEVGERIVPGEEPVRFFEMTLTRLRDTEWPSAGHVGRR